MFGNENRTVGLGIRFAPTALITVCEPSNGPFLTMTMDGNSGRTSYRDDFLSTGDIYIWFKLRRVQDMYFFSTHEYLLGTEISPP
jgi:hypothetical protein